MPVMDVKAQSIGSALTYARRYALQSILGLAAEDDDGNAASGRQEGKSEPPISMPKRGPKAERVTINGKITNAKETDHGIWFQMGTHPVFVPRNKDGILPPMKGLANGVEAEIEADVKQKQNGQKYYEFWKTITIVPPDQPGDETQITDRDSELFG